MKRLDLSPSNLYHIPASRSSGCPYTVSMPKSCPIRNDGGYGVGMLERFFSQRSIEPGGAQFVVGIAFGRGECLFPNCLVVFLGHDWIIFPISWDIIPTDEFIYFSEW